MMKTNTNRLGILTLTLGLSGTAQAMLHDRGNGMIYDDVLDITWLQDANYAQTSGYDADGFMTWNAALAWAAGLSYSGYDDWRLPTIVDTEAPGCTGGFSGTDCGYNVQTGSAATTVYSELASLFYDTLGNLAYCDTGGACPQSGWGLTNTGPFSNIQPTYYWSSTEDASYTRDAWLFSFGAGSQTFFRKNDVFVAWAVRSGDVAPVPLPAAAWLLGSGLCTLVTLRRRT